MHAAALDGHSRDQEIWTLAAFLGRYGRQPLDVVMRMEVRDAMRLSDEVARMMEQESQVGPGGD